MRKCLLSIKQRAERLAAQTAPPDSGRPHRARQSSRNLPRLGGDI
jgi:hypothetical protein